MLCCATLACFVSARVSCSALKYYVYTSRNQFWVAGVMVSHAAQPHHAVYCGNRIVAVQSCNACALATVSQIQCCTMGACPHTSTCKNVVFAQLKTGLLGLFLLADKEGIHCMHADTVVWQLIMVHSVCNVLPFL